MNVKSARTERIPYDLTGVYDALTTQKKLALVTSAALPRGIGGLLLDVIDEESIDLNVDITDHYIEDNSSIQDHAALRPEEVTLHGVVAEKSLLRANDATSTTSTRDALPFNAELAPSFTDGAVQAKEKASSTSKSAGATPLGTYEDSRGAVIPTAISSTDGVKRSSKQANVFDYLYMLTKGRQFVTVETAWGIWPCMMVKTLRAEQDKESRFVSDFYVTFKAVRFANTVLTQSGQLPNRCQTAESDTAQQGQGGTTDRPVSLLKQAATELAKQWGSSE